MISTRRLEDVCELVMGQAPDGTAYNTEGNGWPLIAGAGDFGDVHPTAQRFTTSASKLSRKGDIILGIRATIGEKVLSDGIYCLGRGVAGLRAKAELDDRYLWHWLTHVRPRLAAKAKGATFKQVTKVDIGDLEISLPLLDQQRRIAAILDKAEELRAKRRAALAKLDTLAQAVFFDMFGDTVTNSKGWDVLSLRDVLSIPLRNGLSPSRKGEVKAKVLTLSAITGSFFDESAWKTSSFLSDPPHDQMVDKCDFLICRGNGNLGLVGKGHFPTTSMQDVAFPDTVIAARVDPQRIERAFLQHIWNSEAVRRQIESLARTTNGTFKVNQSMLEGVSFPSPALALQREFARRVTVVNDLKAMHCASLAQLDALFASLQHRAFRGEL